MKPRFIVFLMVIAFAAACNDTANNSTTQDSTVNTDHTTTVSPANPATPDTARDHMQDSAMGHVDSSNLNKR